MGVSLCVNFDGFISKNTLGRKGLCTLNEVITYKKRWNWDLQNVQSHMVESCSTVNRYVEVPHFVRCLIGSECTQASIVNVET